MISEVQALKVVLADDHPLVRQGVRTVIERAGKFKVVAECDNGREAVAAVRRHEPDIVVMDIGMPDLNGMDATLRIKQLNPEVQILALSMLGDARYVNEMLRAGAAGYLLKDCVGEELELALAAVMRGETYLGRNVVGVVTDELIPESLEGEHRALSLREREVLQLIAEGVSTSDIADRLSLSIKTIESHRKNIMDKLDLHSVAELTKQAIKLGLTNLDS